MKLFVDIETVPEYKFLNDADDEYRIQWYKYCKNRHKDLDELAEEERLGKLHEIYQNNAQYVPEFAKIVTIGSGYFRDGEIAAIAKTNANEAELLEWFFNICDRDVIVLVGYNSKLFDFPFLVKRSIVNGFELPEVFKVYGKKPWDLPWVDVMEMWSAGNWRANISLDLVCYKLGIKGCKNISSSNVSQMFFSGDYENLNKHCKSDVVSMMKLWEKLQVVKCVDRR